MRTRSLYLELVAELPQALSTLLICNTMGVRKKRVRDALGLTRKVYERRLLRAVLLTWRMGQARGIRMSTNTVGDWSYAVANYEEHEDYRGLYGAQPHQLAGMICGCRLCRRWIRQWIDPHDSDYRRIWPMPSEIPEIPQKRRKKALTGREYAALYAAGEEPPP